MDLEMTEPQHITQWLQRWQQGEDELLPRLMEVLGDALFGLARKRFAREHPAHTLEPAALINELYLRLQSGIHIDWRNRAHFFAVCSSIMQRILIDHARKRQSAGPKDKRYSLTHTDGLLHQELPPMELLDLQNALDELGQVDPVQHRVVVLRFYGGLNIAEVAEVLGVTSRTVNRKWATARLWLLGKLRGIV